uniref:Uncharacterized protein n=1 Tax=Vitis vinifera TaxID=29760 RepID=F6HSH8_VITVI
MVSISMIASPLATPRSEADLAIMDGG